MINATQIRNGMIIIHNKMPHKVVNFRFAVAGRGANTIPVKLKNILTNDTVEHRFRSDDKVELTDVDEASYEYLYTEETRFWFMHSETFEQISIEEEELEDVKGYLTPNCSVKIQSYEGRPITVTPATVVSLEVTETTPQIKGATLSGSITKPATCETGLVIQVPMFVERGDIILINTVTGEYQGRPGK